MPSVKITSNPTNKDRLTLLLGSFDKQLGTAADQLNFIVDETFRKMLNKQESSIRLYPYKVSDESLNQVSVLLTQDKTVSSLQQHITTASTNRVCPMEKQEKQVAYCSEFQIWTLPVIEWSKSSCMLNVKHS